MQLEVGLASAGLQASLAVAAHAPFDFAFVGKHLCLTFSCGWLRSTIVRFPNRERAGLASGVLGGLAATNDPLVSPDES